MANSTTAQRRAAPTTVVATRLTSEEHAVLQRLQEITGMSTADQLRALIELGSELLGRPADTGALAMT